MQLANVVKYLTITSDEFKKYKEHYSMLEHLYQSHPSNVIFDPGIFSILHKLNQFEGVASVFSCEGHPEKESDPQCYVMLVVTSAGLQNVFEIFSELKEGIAKSRMTNSLRDNLLRLAFSSRRVSMPISSTSDWRPVVIISYTYLMQSCKAAFLKLFNETLSSVLGEAEEVEPVH